MQHEVENSEKYKISYYSVTNHYSFKRLSLNMSFKKTSVSKCNNHYDKQLNTLNLPLLAILTSDHNITHHNQSSVFSTESTINLSPMLLLLEVSNQNSVKCNIISGSYRLSSTRLTTSKSSFSTHLFSQSKKFQYGRTHSPFPCT